MSLLKQFLGLFEPSANHYSYEIEEGVNGLGETVFVVSLLLPNTGWVYLKSGDRVDNVKQWAERYPSKERAEKAALHAVTFHKEMNQGNSIKWK